MVESLINNLEEVQQKVKAYCDRLNPYYAGIANAEEAPLWMAGLAAFPIAVNIELMYQLWANFRELKDLNGKTHQLPALVVNDCILSPLFRVTGRDIFEINADTRAYLLNKLKENFGTALIEDLASFLYKYFQHNKTGNFSKNFYDAQEWTAILAVNPKEAALNILDSLKNKLATNDRFESIGITNLIAALVKDNQGFAEIMRHALDKKDETIWPPTPSTQSSNLIQKTLMLRTGDSANAVSIELPPELSSRLGPLYQAGSVKTFPKEIIEPEKGTTYAMIVALNEYKELSIKLTKSVADASSFINVLENKKLLEKENLKTFYDKDATYKAITKNLEELLSKAAKSDTVVFYYCGNGVQEMDGNYLCLYDSGTSNSDKMQNILTNQEFQSIVSRFAINDPTIVVMLDCCYAGSRSWLMESNPKHFVLMGSQADELSFERPSMTDFFAEVFNKSKQNLTYKNIGKYLLMHMEQQTPSFAIHENSWDNYFLTTTKENQTMATQQMLVDIGYSLFIDGKEGAQLQQALDDFKKKYTIYQPPVMSVGDELQQATFLKDQQYIRITFFYESETEPFADRLKNALANHRVLMNPFLLNEFTSDHRKTILNTVRQNDLILIGLNKKLINDTDQLRELEIILQFIYILDKKIYFVKGEIQENWNHPVINKYLAFPFDNNIFIHNEEGLQAFLSDLLPIITTLEQHLKPFYETTTDPIIESIIKEAKKTKRLDLGGHSLSEIPPSVFTLTKLITLNLSNNEIEDIPEEVGKLANLEEINLSHNPFQRLPEEIGELDELEKMDLSNTEIDELPKDMIKLLKLKSLNIDNTKVRILDRETFMTIPLEDFTFKNTSLLNFATADPSKKITFRDFKTYFSSPRSQRYSIIEIHSENARPHFSNMVGNLKKDIHYKFFDGIDTLPRLFKTICNEMTESNIVVYLCDEKNILCPQFGVDSEQQTMIYQYFKAFDKPLNLMINNPKMQSHSFADLTGPGDLNFVAVRNDKPITGLGFPELFFETMWNEPDEKQSYQIYISSTYNPNDQEYRQFVNELRISEYLVLGPNQNISPNLPVVDKALDDIRIADVIIIIIGESKLQMPGQTSVDKSFLENEYRNAREAGKQIIVFMHDTNQFNPDSFVFAMAEELKKNYLVQFFSNVTDLVSKARGALAQLHGSVNPDKKMSLLNTLKKIRRSNPLDESGYTLHANYDRMEDFSFPGHPASLPTQETAQKSSTAIQSDNIKKFKNKYILIVGISGNNITTAQSLACQAIGKALAMEGYGIITGGWPGVDMEICKSFTDTFTTYKKTVGNALMQVLMESQKQEYGQGKVEWVKNNTDWYNQTIKSAFALIIIGGVGGTNTSYQLARKRSVPVIPIPGTDGVAKKAYEEILKLKGYPYPKTLLQQLDVEIQFPTIAEDLSKKVLDIIREIEKPKTNIKTPTKTRFKPPAHKPAAKKKSPKKK